MNYSSCKAKFPILSHKGRWKKGFKKHKWKDINALMK